MFKRCVVVFSLLALVSTTLYVEAARRRRDGGGRNGGGGKGGGEFQLPLPGLDCFISRAELTLKIPPSLDEESSQQQRLQQRLNRRDRRRDRRNGRRDRRGRKVTVHLSGPTIIRRGAVEDGVIPIEIVTLNLVGSHPELGAVRVIKRQQPPSRGKILLRSGRRPFPATSFFDVFVEIQKSVGGQEFVLRPPNQIRMAAKLTRIPPIGTPYKGNLPRSGLPLLLPNGQPSGLVLLAVIHIPLQPLDCFVPAGVDCFDSEAFVDIDYPPFSPTGTPDTTFETIRLQGPTLIRRGDPGDADKDGLLDIPNEIVSLELRGTSQKLGGPIIFTNNPDHENKASTGVIEQRTPGQNFPADSFFDVFFEIHTPLGIAGQGKTRVEAPNGIKKIPPENEEYRAPHAADVVDPFTGQVIAKILGVKHIPRRQVEWLDEYPGADVDVFDSLGSVVIAFPNPNKPDEPDPNPLNHKLWFADGPTVILRGNPRPNPERPGLLCIDTEIVSMCLKGTSPLGPFQIVAGLLCDAPIRSTGFIWQRRPGFPFPADSCFDVYFQVIIRLQEQNGNGPVGGTQVLRLCPRPQDRARLCSVIHSLPPRTPYCPPGQTALFIPLFICDESGNPINAEPFLFVKIECHLPRP